MYRTRQSWTKIHNQTIQLMWWRKLCDIFNVLQDFGKVILFSISCHYCTISFIEFNITRNPNRYLGEFLNMCLVFSHHIILIDHSMLRMSVDFWRSKTTTKKRFSRNICLYYKLRDHRPRSFSIIQQQKIIQKTFSWCDFFPSSLYYYIWINRMK